ncbi:hypothetical protein M0802_000220 [Mischocyttarus mexicanus]|nr:hypothetical protein M0802_000220 [Mischocyttarus mexicanus]
MSIKILDMLRHHTVYNLSVKQIQSAIYPYRGQMYSSSKSNNELNYNSDHSDHILKILNNQKIDFFKRYEIPQFHAIELHKYREKYGAYKSLKDILKIEGMTKEISDKFILSIINYKQFTKDKKMKRYAVLSSLKNIPVKQISTIVGIYIENNIISWTLLETKENVLEWNYENLLENKKKENTSGLLELSCTLKDKIPTADIYVLNDTNFNFQVTKSVSHFQHFVRKEQLRAMILALLTQKNLSLQVNGEVLSNFNNIHLLKCENIAKFFKIYVGKEITSTAKIIKRLLCKTDGINKKIKHPISVYIQHEIMTTYNKQIDTVKDQMNWSLLIALTFLQLGVLEKYDCNFVENN